MPFQYSCFAEVRMLFYSVTHLILFLFLAAFWIFVFYVLVRSFQALKGIEKSIADIAETLRAKS
jgi:hypothetical protein